MTLLTGPLLSEEARGTLAGLLTYSRRRGRNVAGRRNNPKQPRTFPQRALRVSLAGLAKLWAGLTPAEQATWHNYPQLRILSPYHAYQKANIARLLTLPNVQAGMQARDAHPTAAWPATKATAQASWTGDTLTGGSRSAEWKINWTTLNDAWFAIFHLRNAPEPWPILQNTIGLFAIDGLGWQTFRLENLPPGPAAIAFVPVSRTALPRDSYWWRNTTINP